MLVNLITTIWRCSADLNSHTIKSVLFLLLGGLRFLNKLLSYCQQKAGNRPQQMLLVPLGIIMESSRARCWLASHLNLRLDAAAQLPSWLFGRGKKRLCINVRTKRNLFRDRISACYLWHARLHSSTAYNRCHISRAAGRKWGELGGRNVSLFWHPSPEKGSHFFVSNKRNFQRIRICGELVRKG